PFAELEKQLALFKVAAEAYAPTLFDAGFAPQACAVGYVGYDSVAYMERIPLPARDHEPHGFYDACLVIFSNLLVFDHVRSRVRLIELIFDPAREADSRSRQEAIFATLSKGEDPEALRFD